MTIRNTRAEIASFRETVNATKTMIVLLTRLPTIGTSPQRNVTTMSNGACGMRIVRRNGDLRPHNRGKASVKVAEPSCDLLAADGVKIIFDPMRAAVRVKPCFEEQTRSSDDSQNAENQIRGGRFGHVSNVAKIIRFLAKRVHHDLPQTFKITKG